MKRNLNELLRQAHTETMQNLFIAGITANAALIPKHYSQDDVMTVLEHFDYYPLCDTDETICPLFDRAFDFLSLYAKQKYPKAVKEFCDNREEQNLDHVFFTRSCSADIRAANAALMGEEYGNGADM